MTGAGDPARPGGERAHPAWAGPPPWSDGGDTDFSAWGVPLDEGGALPGAAALAASAQPDAAREARRLLASGDGAALPRVLRTYALARVALGLALLAAPFVMAVGGARTPWWVMAISAAYAVQTMALWVLRQLEPQGRPLAPDRLDRRQWWWTVGVDLLAFSLLRLLEPPEQLNYAALLVLPVLMGGVLTGRRTALGTTAGVVLVLLAAALLDDAPRGGSLAPVSQAGLAGAGLFAITLLANELALRLAGEALNARTHQAHARQQELLNRVVIEEMGEGVLVVDRQGLVRALNPAAAGLLGLDQATAVMRPLDRLPGQHALAAVLLRAYQSGAWPDDARELTVTLPDGRLRQLQLRARFTRRAGIGVLPGADGGSPEDICVLLLEDARTVQARLRQDKLAAMGRMSAGIAHEIRNPLAAIAQANALLLEDELTPAQRQLGGIVADNAERLKRIVDDVLTVANLQAPVSTALDVGHWVPQLCEEWRRAAPAAWQADRRLVVQVPDLADGGPALRAWFDAEHLRRVLVNLLDNGMRHASMQDGAVRVRLQAGADGERLGLYVASDGEPIPLDTERHLFEPFFSTRSRGTGLGLYICRELCARHGARIDFLPRPAGRRHRNVFRVLMRPGRGPAPGGRGAAPTAGPPSAAGSPGAAAA